MLNLEEWIEIYDSFGVLCGLFFNKRLLSLPLDASRYVDPFISQQQLEYEEEKEKYEEECRERQRFGLIFICGDETIFYAFYNFIINRR